jgi:hypothetical protein
MKNEGVGVAEWIAYHLAVGFSSVVIYDNDSTDETREVIAKMSQVGDVRCVDWPRADPGFQVGSYADALERFGAEFEWMLFLDGDEFILPMQHSSIEAVMATYPQDVAAVGFHWLIYGSSGHAEQPAGSLVIEAFLRHSEPGFGPNCHIKTALRPHRAMNVVNSHAFEVVGRYVTGNGLDAEWLQARPGPTVAPPDDYGAARINHYFTKSLSQWRSKLLRGYHDAERRDEDFYSYDRNELEDELILEHRAATLDLMAAAKCLPGSR